MAWTARPFFIATYPKEWSAHYFENDFVNADPVVLSACRGVVPFKWSGLLKDRSGSKRQQQVLNEAREFRLNNGMTVPIHGPGSTVAEFSVTTEHRATQFDELCARHRHHLHALSFYLHEAIFHDLYPAPTGEPIQLSPRQLECLLWTARGKTAWEISEILSISEDTVVHYLKSAQQKLGVYKKTHAVVKAILFGYITP